jgi:hypothetical protein
MNNGVKDGLLAFVGVWLMFRGGVFGRDRIVLPNNDFSISANPFFVKVSYASILGERVVQVLWRPIDFEKPR